MYSRKLTNVSIILGHTRKPTFLMKLASPPTQTKIRPFLEYACPIWGGIRDYLSLELQRVQDRCLKILSLPKDAVETLASRRRNPTKNELERMMSSDTFKHLFKQSEHDYNLRHKKCNQVPLSRTVRHQQSFVLIAQRL